MQKRKNSKGYAFAEYEEK